MTIYAIEDLCNLAGAPKTDNDSSRMMTLGERVAWMLMEIRRLKEKVSAFKRNAPAPPLVNESVTRQSILEEAIRCVTKDRNSTHGNPEDNFARIADYWTTYLKTRGIATNFIKTEDVAALMILMKVSRLATSPEHRDHWIDIAGYAACGGEIACKPLTDPKL